MEMGLNPSPFLTLLQKSMLHIQSGTVYASTISHIIISALSKNKSECPIESKNLILRVMCLLLPLFLSDFNPILSVLILVPVLI